MEAMSRHVKSAQGFLHCDLKMADEKESNLRFESFHFFSVSTAEFPAEVLPQ